MAEEFEVTLRTAAADPEALFTDIASARSIGGYALSPAGSEDMHDCYFDTREGDLGKRSYALRLRTVHGRTLLCLKGREKINDWGGVRRLEIEGLWSRPMLEQVMGEMKTGGLAIRSFDAGNALATLTDMGFVIVQSRQTRRTALAIHIPHKDRPIGEMALDRVCYEAMGKRFLHYEVEIEAAKGMGPEMMEGLVSSLKDAFPGMLLRWDYNKLVTGCAVEALVREGVLSAADRKEDLIPEPWYRTIETRIRERCTFTGPS